MRVVQLELSHFLMSFHLCEVPYLATLQYPKKLYRYQLSLQDASLYSVSYSSTSLILPHCAHCLVVINRKAVERFDLRLGRPAEALPDAPFVLSNAVVVCTNEGLLALWTNSRAYHLNFTTREWTPRKSDVEKLPSLYCMVDNSKVLMLYAHTIWLTNRTSYFSEGTMEGRVFDVEKGESVLFALQLDLVGHFGCVQVAPGQVLLFGGYEEMRFNGSCLLDGNSELYVLDLTSFQVKKVGSLCKRLEEPNIVQRPLLCEGFVHCLSGRELLRINLSTFDSEVVRVSALQVRNVFVLLWVYEKLRKEGKKALSFIPPCLVRETTLYLTAVWRS